jgi:general nucleoside transport system ATP-binding protein
VTGSGNYAAPALEVRDISVAYGAVRALQSVSLEFGRGGIHAVVGQNGAGKTSFSRVCAGLIRPNSGTVLVEGTEIGTGNVRLARHAGVELVHQSFALPMSFTVAECMEFGARGGQFFTSSSIARRWEKHIADLGLKVRLSDRIRDLPVEIQQSVEIARALVLDARVLILDEPTAVLAPGGVDLLFQRLRRLRDAGVTIVLILHKIREVMELAETVSVLRGGRLVEAARPVAGASREELVTAIMGAAVSTVVSARASSTPGPTVLRFEKLSTRTDAQGVGLASVDMELRCGEIVGIAGVEGNGQRALVRAIAGLAPVTSGTIRLRGTAITREPPLTRRARGVRVIPFERNIEGLSRTSALWKNWAARLLLLRHALAWVSPGRLRREAETALRRWDVRFASTEQPAGSLSGGNAQKLILAREIDDDAAVIVAAQPTRGLDVGATLFVLETLRAAAERGAGVVMISSDLDELFAISDRLLVISGGAIVAAFSAPFQLAAVGAAMTLGRPT